MSLFSMASQEPCSRRRFGPAENRRRGFPGYGQGLKGSDHLKGSNDQLVSVVHVKRGQHGPQPEPRSPQPRVKTAVVLCLMFESNAVRKVGEWFDALVLRPFLAPEHQG
eukprot:s2900_g5.t1